MLVQIDFVSPHNIERIVKITRELRTCSWAQSYKEDILALNVRLLPSRLERF